MTKWKQSKMKKIIFGAFAAAALGQEALNTIEGTESDVIDENGEIDNIDVSDFITPVALDDEPAANDGEEEKEEGVLYVGPVRVEEITTAVTIADGSDGDAPRLIQPGYKHG